MYNIFQVYCRSRRRALRHTLRHLHSDVNAAPYFIFGDFNFRNDTGGVVKVRNCLIKPMIYSRFISFNAIVDQIKLTHDYRLITNSFHGEGKREETYLSVISIQLFLRLTGSLIRKLQI